MFAELAELTNLIGFGHDVGQGRNLGRGMSRSMGCSASRCLRFSLTPLLEVKTKKNPQFPAG